MSDATQTQDHEPSTRQDIDIFNESCWAFMLCLKIINLYPDTHPRVTKSLDVFKNSVLEVRQRTGQPFSFDTVHLPEPGENDGGLLADVHDLRHILKTHFIERLTVEPTVNKEELFELCRLLHEDFYKNKEAEEDEITIRPQSWKHIVINFYLPRDFSTGEAVSETLMDQFAAIDRIKNLAPRLDELPEDLSKRLSGALMSSTLIGEISELCESVERERPLDVAVEEGGDFDLVGEILGTFISESQDADQRDLDENEIVAILQVVVEFLHENVDSLLTTLRPYENEPGSEGVRGQIREIVQNSFDLSKQVKDLQTLKERLSSLFRVAPTSGEEMPVEDLHSEPSNLVRPEMDSGAKKSAGSGSQPQEDVSLESSIESVPLNLLELRKIAKQFDVSFNYLQIVLHFLRSKEYAVKTRERWPVVVETVRELNPSAELVEKAVGELTDFLAAGPCPEAEELLLVFLDRLDVSQRGIDSFAKLVVLPNGRSIIESFLDNIVESDSDLSVPLLTNLTQTRNSDICEIAEKRLLHLARNPLVLGSWIAADVVAFCNKRILSKVLFFLSTDHVREGFAKGFDRITHKDALKLVRSLPAGVARAEHVLFVAMDSRSQELRCEAISGLGKYPHDVVLSTLKGLVNENNHRDAPNLREVEAALGALVDMDNPDAKRFLKEIQSKKKGLGHAYRKDIRKLLSTVQGSRRAQS